MGSSGYRRQSFEVINKVIESIQAGSFSLTGAMPSMVDRKHMKPVPHQRCEHIAVAAHVRGVAVREEHGTSRLGSLPASSGEPQPTIPQGRKPGRAGANLI